MPLYNYPLSFFCIYLVMLAVPIMATSIFIRKSTDQGKIQYIEGLRGFACIAVFINHSAYAIGDMLIKTKNIDYSNFYLFSQSGALGVQIFFCITGFLFSSKILSNNKIDFTSFYAKRIKRLVPLYLFTATLISVIYFSQMLGKLDFPLFVTQLLKIFGFGFFGTELYWGEHRDATLNIVLWTLPYEWKFYASIPFLATALYTKKFKYMVIAFGCFVLINDFYEDKVLWSYFVAGALCAKIKEINIEKISLRAVIYIIFAFLFYMSFYFDVKQYSFYRFVMISLMFASCVVLKPRLLSIPSIAFLGEISYSIYLLHQPVLHVFYRIASKFVNLSETNTTQLIIYSVTCLSITILASAFTYKHIECRFNK